MAVVVPTMPPRLASWGAGRPRECLSAHSGAPALKTLASHSSAAQLYGGDDHGACQQWLWQKLSFDARAREYATRAAIQRTHRHLRAELARRVRAPRVGARPHVPARVQRDAAVQLWAARVVTSGGMWGPCARDGRGGSSLGRTRARYRALSSYQTCCELVDGSDILDAPRRSTRWAAASSRTGAALPRVGRPAPRGPPARAARPTRSR